MGLWLDARVQPPALSDSCKVHRRVPSVSPDSRSVLESANSQFNVFRACPAQSPLCFPCLCAPLYAYLSSRFLRGSCFWRVGLMPSSDVIIEEKVALKIEPNASVEKEENLAPTVDRGICHVIFCKGTNSWNSATRSTSPRFLTLACDCSLPKQLGLP